MTVWEVWSGGAEPWPGLSSDAVLAELKAARRLAWPRTTCPRRLYQLLLATWRYEPAHRPSFEYLVERLDKVCPVFRDHSVQFRYFNFVRFRVIMKLWSSVTLLAIKLVRRVQLTRLVSAEHLLSRLYHFWLVKVRASSGSVDVLHLDHLRLR